MSRIKKYINTIILLILFFTFIPSLKAQLYDDKSFKDECILADDLINDIERRIDEFAVDKHDLEVFYEQLIFVKKLFEHYKIDNYLEERKAKLKLYEFENNTQNTSLNNIKTGIALFRATNNKVEKYKINSNKINLILRKIDELLYRLWNRKVRVSDKLLFTVESPLYSFETWSLIIIDFKHFYNEMVLNFSEFKISFKFYMFCLWIALLIIYLLSLKRIKLSYLGLMAELKKNQPIIDTKHIEKVLDIIFRAILPVLLIYLAAKNCCSFNSFISGFIMSLAVSLNLSIILFISLKCLLNRGTCSHRKCFMIGHFTVITFFILFINNINPFEFSTQFFPYFGVRGVAFLNLVLCIVLSLWTLICIKHIRKNHKVNKKVMVLINILKAIVLISPLAIFIGYSYFITGLLVNILQTVLAIFFLILIYRVIVSLTPILISKIYLLYLYKIWKIKKRSSDRVLKPDRLLNIPIIKNMVFWLNKIIYIIFIIVICIVVALEWGTPPIFITTFFSTILFYPIPIGNNSVFSVFSLLNAIFIFICSLVIFIAFSEFVFRYVLRHTSSDKGTKYAVKMFIRYIGAVIALAIGVYSMGVDSKTITFILSGLSIGVGFALKGTITNFISGIIVLITRYVRVDDWVYTTDKKIEGNVEHIGLHSTIIRQFDKRTILVPNNILNSNALVNASRMSNRRIKQYIGVRYDDIPVINEIINNIHSMLYNHPAIDKSQTIHVNMVDGNTDMGSSVESCFGNYSVNLEIYAYTKTTHWTEFQGLQNNIMLKIADIITECGAEIAYPTKNIYIKKK